MGHRGQSWNRFNKGLRQQNIGMLLVAAHQGEPLVLAAGSSRGLFVSSAQTADWRRTISDDVQVSALGLAEESVSTYALAGDSTGGIWKSDGELENWQRIIRLKNVGAITSFAAVGSPGPANTFLVGTEKSGLLRISESGAALEHLSRSWPDLHVRDIKSSSNGADIFVTTWNRAVHVSRDAGQSWSILSKGLRRNAQADARSFAMPHFRGLEMGGAGRPDWFLAGFDGLYRSEDSGKSWVQFETMPVSLIRGIGISPAFGRQHKLLVTTYGGGAYISSDQGRAWSIANNGLISTRLADAEFSPEYWNDGHAFSVSKGRLLASDNIENGWSALSLVYNGWRRRVGLALDERGGIWPMQIELSPSFGLDQTMLLGFRRHGVWISDDAGASWDRSWDGPTDYVTDLQISPEFPSDGTVFAGIRGAGIYVSRDGAKSWHAANEGFEYFADFQATKAPNHFIDPPLSRAITDVVLAISPRYAEDLTVYAGSAAGIFRSTDGGQAWQKLSLASSLQNVPVIGLGISPAYGGGHMILASTRGGKLYRSTDAGKTFEAIGENLLQDNVELKFIRFSPSFQHDNIIYGASDRELRISRDQGDTWVVIKRPVRYEDWRGATPGPVWFTGSWFRETGAHYSASTQTATDSKGARATLNFVGNTVSWFGERGPSGGQARIMIDGIQVASIDLYSKQQSAGSELLKLSALNNKPHSIVIEVSDENNPHSTGHRVTVDNIDVSH